MAAPAAPKAEKAAAKADKAAAKADKAAAKAEKAPKPAAKAQAAPAKALDDVTRLEFRVGKITKVWPHPEADKLWCEEIDLGTEVRQIASGLREHKMLGATVVVLANLKAKPLRGFTSHGMVMCAEGPTTQLLEVPAGAQVGEQLRFEGLQGEADAELPTKSGKNPLEVLMPDLKTDAQGNVSFKGSKLMSSKGPAHSNLKGVQVK